MDLTYETVNKEQSYLEAQRKDYEKVKRLCCDLAYPDRVSSWDWLFSTTGASTPGKKYSGFYKRTHDGTAKYAFEVWRNGIMGHFFPKQINWFREYYSDRKLKDSRAVIKWLQDTDEHMVSVLNNSGSVGCDNDYYNQKRWFLGDAGCIGDSFLFIERDRQTNKQFFMAVHPKDCWIRRDFWGRIVNVHYRMGQTLGKLVQEFSIGSLSEAQKISYQGEGGADAPVTVIYGIYKNYDYMPGRPGTMNMPWQTVYVNMEGKKAIRHSGEYTLNPVPFSMRRPSDWSYGQGVVYSNIIECLLVDEIGKTMLMGAQQAVNPAMLVSSAIMNKLRLNPGAVNKVDSKSMAGVKMGDMLARIVDSNGYPFGRDQQELWIELVNKRFGVPLFVALNAKENSGRTAFEVNQIKAEQAVLLGPTVSEISSVTDMEFDRIYQLELDSGDAPEPPGEILESNQGRIDLNYIGPLNQLLKQYYESNALLTTIGYIQQVLTIAPEAAVVFDGDELLRKIMRSANSPEELILTDMEVQEIRAMSAQIAEDQRQAQLLGEGSKGAANLSKNIEPNSILARLEQAA